MTYDETKKDYYSKIGAVFPPFIKVSSQHYFCSYAGCLHRPVEYIHSELKRKYPADWNKSIQQSESLFRKDLYLLFNRDNFITMENNIVIKSESIIITDIDACIIDKNTKEIALF